MFILNILSKLGGIGDMFKGVFGGVLGTVSRAFQGVAGGLAQLGRIGARRPGGTHH